MFHFGFRLQKNPEGCHNLGGTTFDAIYYLMQFIIFALLAKYCA